MSKIALPPLTPKEIAARDYQDILLDPGLRECWHGSNFDAERAEKLTRAYAIEIFKTIRNFYSAKFGYRAEWLPKIVVEAEFRAVMVYKRHRKQDLGQIARDAVMHYLRTTSINERARSEFNAAFPAADHVSNPQIASEKKSELSAHTDVPETLGEQLKHLLNEGRIRPEDIAEEIEIEPRNVYRHLAGETYPSLSNLGKYEKALSKHLSRPIKLPTSAKRQ